MSKIKLKSYGLTTPVRRGTNNITGHKVGGMLSGGECKIIRFKRLIIEKNKKINLKYQSVPVNLFDKNIAILALGGYFISNQDINIEITISYNLIDRKKVFILKENVYQKIGIEIELEINEIGDDTLYDIEINFISDTKTTLQYTNLGLGYIDSDYYKETDVYAHFYNSKREICYPEQFYFDQDIILEDSDIGDLIILKSCNRCQRFLPINHMNERIQLAFSNHCSAKAPCTHGNFSNYQIKESVISDEELKVFIANTPYKISQGFIYSHYGHQLECKSCKKFFVNAALNHLRTSTQHREDSLRRRSFEILTRHLLNIKSIYHSFLEENLGEFDEYIWKKFNKSCFNCNEKIESPRDMNLDHTMPLVYLYPLDKSATCLCSSCNSSKSDIFPVDFYSLEKLEALSRITELDIELLKSRNANEIVIKELKKNIIWFFEEFLTFPEYTKIRDGKTAANSILHSLQKIVNNSSIKFDLLEEYKMQKG